MNFDISAWCIRNPLPTILLFVLLTILGVLGFRAMKIQNFPDIDLPTINLITVLPGASPSQLENDVARKIENSIASIQGIKHISTNLNDGVVHITTEFHLEKSVQEAVTDLRDAVSRIKITLPFELRDPVINKMDIASAPILTYTISSSNLNEKDLSWFVDDELTRKLLSVPGVGAVARVGGVEREIRVNLNPSTLLSLNTSADYISTQLRQTQHESPGGRATLNGNEQSIRILGTVKTAEEVGAIEIALRDGRYIRLNQIAEVIDSFADKRSAVLLNGEAVIGFEISRTRGSSEIEVAKNVKSALSALRQAHSDLKITEVLNNVELVQENYLGSIRLLLEGALLAIVVVFLFLRDWRATSISALALPLSVIPTFAVIYWMGFTINTVTLLSLSIMIGIVVDDTIVEIENIQRHLSLGKPPYEAALSAAKEIGFAVIATSLTLVAVFLPTAFMQGMIGKFFLQFGWTAAVAVFFSLIVARMLTPMMAAYLLRHPKQQKEKGRWIDSYLSLVHWCLRNRFTTVLSVMVMLVLSIAMSFYVPATFMPSDDNWQSQVTLSLPPGSMLETTLDIAEKARRIIQTNPQIEMVYTTIGSGSAGNDPLNFTSQSISNVSTAILTLQLTKPTKRSGLTKQQIESQLRIALAETPGTRVKVGTEDSEHFELVLSGNDYYQLEKVSHQVSRELRNIQGLGAITSSASLIRPELNVRPDFARFADAGVTSDDISKVLRVATNGDYIQDLSKLNLSQRQIPIVVRLPTHAREDISLLKRLPVQGTKGAVPLESVAEFQLSSGPAEIVRYDRVRNINFAIELNGIALSDVRKKVLALPSLKNLPSGVQQSSVGDAEAMDELNSGFSIAMMLGGICIYIILVLLFRDFLQPITVLAAMVLSIPGAVLALFITGTQLSMPSLIGLIMLMGITTKNSILLIDYIFIAQNQYGLNRSEAIIDACRKRVKPIVMTTIAMVAGMLPITLGWGSDSSFRAPMAIVVVGGLITSTLLSLLFIPVMFSYVDELVKSIGMRKPVSAIGSAP